jgi:predicted dehydrogenase
MLKISGKQLLLTHTYTGYPMIKQARHMIKDGTFGKIQKIYVEYPQGHSAPISKKRTINKLAVDRPFKEW